MRFAIDRFIAGTETEVCAKDFYDTYILNKDNRFYCPECGEKVFWRSRGGSQPDKFCHYKKEDSSPECDRRVDGLSGLTIYERVGMPLYIVSLGDSYFQLNVCVPSFSASELKLGSVHKTRLLIKSGNRCCYLHIDSTDCIEDEHTLIPIDFTPFGLNPYEVEISGDTSTNLFSKRIGSSIEGLGPDGLVFTYGDYSGRRIKKGDSVYTNKKYYVVSKRLFTPPTGMIIEHLGYMMLNGVRHYVYLMKVIASTRDEKMFRYVEQFLVKSFGLWLLETPPEIIPIWPPVTNRGECIPVNNSSTVYVNITSGNDTPKVFSYDGTTTNEVCTYSLKNGGHMTRLSIGTVPCVVSVDRKYTGREMVFINRNIDNAVYIYDIEMFNNNQVVVSQEFKKTDIYPQISVSSKSKLDAFFINKYEMVQSRVLKESCTEVIPIDDVKKIVFCVENRILKEYCICRNEVDFVSSENELYIELKKCLYGELTCAPSSYYQYILKMRKLGFNRISDLLIKNIKNGKIPSALQRKLYLIKTIGMVENK